MSGLYMGDCARRLLLSFAQRAELFGDVIPEALSKKDSFTTAGELDSCSCNTTGLLHLQWDRQYCAKVTGARCVEGI